METSETLVKSSNLNNNRMYVSHQSTHTCLFFQIAVQIKLNARNAGLAIFRHYAAQMVRQIATGRTEPGKRFLC